MQKITGEKETTDEENAEVFAEHFCKVFNNPDPLPCNETALPFIPTCLELPGPSGITSDAFCALVFCRPDPDKTGIYANA
eukprot:10411612-Ditylum_brightwellii.AAC.1